MELKKLAQEQFISLGDGFATFADAKCAFEIAGFELKIVAKVQDIFSVLSMVQSGLGMALLPGRVFSVFERRVGFYPLAERYQQRQNLGIVFDRSREHEPNLLALAAEGRMFALKMAALKAEQLPPLNER